MEREHFKGDEVEVKYCAVDLDGVLTAYPEEMLKFFNGFDHDFWDLDDAKTILSYKEYVDLKRRWRESPAKQYMAAREGAAYFMQELRRRGYSIVVTTSRPAEEHPHLVAWTAQWLEAHEMPYCELLFNRHRPLMLLERHPDVEFVVDDEVEKLGIPYDCDTQRFHFTVDKGFDGILEAVE